MISKHNRNHTPKVLIAFGTRPELIKLAPLISRIENVGTRSDFLIVSTSQHTELLKDQFEFWGVQPDIILPSVPGSGNLTRMLAASLNGLQDVIDQYPSIEYILVQGDTNTVLTCAHLAFLNQKKLIHVEAGLRTHDLQSPFPEEYNRMMVSKAAHYHFVPSEKNRLNLLQEGCSDEHIMVTGNTVIDALHTGFAKAGITMLPQPLRQDVIITLHRRENAESFRQLIQVVGELSAALPELNFLWITHPNYTIENRTLLQAAEGITVMEHLPYVEFIGLYTSARFVITDSGGSRKKSRSLEFP